jgi:transcriptional regulator with XRE-family HTH domain
MGRPSKHQNNPVYLVLKEAGYTLRAFAVLLGLSYSEVKSVENGKRGLTYRVRERISRCCGAIIAPVAEPTAECQFRVCGANGEPYTSDTFKQHSAKKRAEGVHFDQMTLIEAVRESLKAASGSKRLDLASEDLYWDLERLVAKLGLTKWFRDKIKSAAKTNDPVEIRRAHVYCCLARLEPLRSTLPPVPADIASVVDCWKRIKVWERKSKQFAQLHPKRELSTKSIA